METLKAPKFGTRAHWDTEFAKDGIYGENFDWLASWTDIKDLVASAISRKNLRILIPGCGNARFQLEMHDAGYTNMVCGDNCPIVIEKMRAAKAELARSIQWDVMDVTSMPYGASSFDVVIDKSLMDCLHCCDDAVQIVRRYFDEVFRILAPGGTFILVSFHGEAAVRANLRGRAWQVTRLDDITSSVQGATADEPGEGSMGAATSGVGSTMPSNQTSVFFTVCTKVAVRTEESRAQGGSDRKKARKMERRMLRASLEGD